MCCGHGAEPTLKERMICLEHTTAIGTAHITKRFGKVVANDDISLEIRRGEILSLLGENGSGKTTLMNMISGIYFPDEGHICVGGREVTIRSPKDAYALGIGMIHQTSSWWTCSPRRRTLSWAWRGRGPSISGPPPAG